MRSLVECLEYGADLRGKKLLFSFLDLQGNVTESYTYRELHERSCHLADYLLHTGAKRGDRALLVYPSGLEAIVAFVACARIGVLPVPAYAPALNLEAGAAKLAFIAKDCQATFAFTTVAFNESFQLRLNQNPQLSPSVAVTSQLTWITTDNVAGRAPAFQNDFGSSELFLQYTSGSTCDPRGVIVSHENVIHNAISTIDHVPTGVSWLPQYHDLGFLGYYLYPIITGGTTYGFSPTDFLRRPILWLQAISRYGATYASSPNFGFDYCLREDKVPTDQLIGLDLSSLRVMMNASESVRADTYLRFFERFAPYGLRREAHVVAYGLAENTLAATHYGKRILSVNKRRFQNGELRIEQASSVNNDQLQIASCGRPLNGIRVRVVNPATSAELDEGEIGEIWIAGQSACRGYWNRPNLTAEVFDNRLSSDPPNGDRFLRTGDLGFFHEQELFVCGRMKDVIIVRGVNYYPNDIETTVESTSPKLRINGVVAFEGQTGEGALIVIAEVMSAKDLPDPADIGKSITEQCHIEPHSIILVPPRTIVRTTSGKISRSATRQRWLDGTLPVLVTHVKGSCQGRARLRHLLESYQLSGHGHYHLADTGVDSLTLVMLIAELEAVLEGQGAARLACEMDGRLLQDFTLTELSALLDEVEKGTDEAVVVLQSVLNAKRREHDQDDRRSMIVDAELKISRIEIAERKPQIRNVLLTGPTGFFGPFLLRSLLRHTNYTYDVLIRAHDPDHGLTRLRNSFRQACIWTPDLEEELNDRVRIVCGDIEEVNLGLAPKQWQLLSTRVEAILHNAAMVNYVRNYSTLRAPNVEGTRELLKFAFTGVRKEFHLISSTIIFGWTVKEMLFESDNNEEMQSLDFGYAQTKWVAEKLVLSAGKQGLDVRIYRPSFLTASTQGIASEGDITVRLLSFMINHGIAVRARNQISFIPADIAAENIGAIFNERNAAQQTLHITADRYYNMIDITDVITKKYGYSFEYHGISDFIVQMKRRCTPEDMLFPLRDFFDRSYLKLAAMQNKRYSNQNYRSARLVAGIECQDPTLECTVSYIMDYMIQQGLIKRSPTARRSH